VLGRFYLWVDHLSRESDENKGKNEICHTSPIHKTVHVTSFTVLSQNIIFTPETDENFRLTIPKGEFIDFCFEIRDGGVA
jgi:hypothetical protein